MRIALLIERLDPARGGTETWVSDFAAECAGGGHDVHVFAREGSAVPEGVTLHAVAVSGVGRAMRTVSFAQNCEAMLGEHDFDIIHGVGKTVAQNVYQPHGGVHAATLEANLRMGGAVSAAFKRLGYRLSLKQRVFRRIERAQYVERPAQVFVALSEMVKRDMQRFYSVPDAKVEVVHNGVDVERFHPRNRERCRAAFRKQFRIGEDETVFLVVAHNFHLKGVPELVRCVTGKFPPCRLVVVGGGNADQLIPFAGRREPGRVLFIGAVVDTAPCYAAADAYVHPTWYDPCSLVVLEALASGLPVVTTSMNGASELMSDGEEGFVIPPGDPRRLRAALVALLDGALREKMGNAARILAEAHTTTHNVRQMMDVYERVLHPEGTA